ncbi:MAG: type II toxin-antitoxin system prevent-host-death family antitoxin [Chloroflexi bacterium]|nr:type II toxin-antitoxin system prevent-host-death family antitoxin [Chloroflexota bacterium]
MRSVNVAELKNNLSTYLHEVQEGEEILIRSRSRPIAKLVPLSSIDDAEAEELALAAAGQLRLPEAPLSDSFWDTPAPSVPLRQAVAAIEADREAR